VTAFEAKIRAFIVDDVEYKKQCQTQAFQTKFMQISENEVATRWPLVLIVGSAILLLLTIYIVRANRKNEARKEFRGEI
jgi:hypothetical protein